MKKNIEFTDEQQAYVDYLLQMKNNELSKKDDKIRHISEMLEKVYSMKTESKDAVVYEYERNKRELYWLHEQTKNLENNHNLLIESLKKLLKLADLYKERQQKLYKDFSKSFIQMDGFVSIDIVTSLLEKIVKGRVLQAKSKERVIIDKDVEEIAKEDNKGFKKFINSKFNKKKVIDLLTPHISGQRGEQIAVVFKTAIKYELFTSYPSYGETIKQFKDIGTRSNYHVQKNKSLNSGNNQEFPQQLCDTYDKLIKKIVRQCEYFDPFDYKTPPF